MSFSISRSCQGWRPGPTEKATNEESEKDKARPSPPSVLKDNVNILRYIPNIKRLRPISPSYCAHPTAQNYLFIVKREKFFDRNVSTAHTQ